MTKDLHYESVLRSVTLQQGLVRTAQEWLDQALVNLVMVKSQINNPFYYCWFDLNHNRFSYTQVTEGSLGRITRTVSILDRYGNVLSGKAEAKKPAAFPMLCYMKCAVCVTQYKDQVKLAKPGDIVLEYRAATEGDNGSYVIAMSETHARTQLLHKEGYPHITAFSDVTSITEHKQGGMKALHVLGQTAFLPKFE